MEIFTGSYSGNSTDSTGITGVGFQPDFVLIKRQGVGGNNAVIKTATMSGDAAKPISAATGLTANLIQTLDADGFTIGDDASVNTSGQTYDFLAIKDDAADFAVGSYTGNATDPTSITGVGFDPTVVLVMGDTTEQATYRAAGHTGDNSGGFQSAGGGTDRIQSLITDGFTIGGDGEVNTNTITYYWAAWKDTAGFSDTGSYTGDGIDDTGITGVGFQPNFVHVGRANGFRDVPVFRGDHAGDLSSHYTTAGAIADLIQAHQADGFQIGINASVNANGPIYGYFAFLDGNSQAAGRIMGAIAGLGGLAGHGGIAGKGGGIAG